MCNSGVNLGARQFWAYVIVGGAMIFGLWQKRTTEFFKERPPSNNKNKVAV